MATKPTTTFNWDDNQTNWLQPAAGLRTDGYATDDIPTSANFNYVLNSIGLWLDYLEEVTDALDTIQSPTDINIICDNDGTSTANAIYFKHNSPATELAKIDEFSNFLLNQATVGTSGAGVIGIANGTAPSTAPADEVQLYSGDFAAGDSRLFIRTESGGTISIGNNAIRNVNTDGTLIVASEKHITMDIDSDNDGTDGLFTVRANATTAALTVTEAGLVTATGNVIATNITATNATDIANGALLAALGRLSTYTSSTDTEVTTMPTIAQKVVLYHSNAGTNYLLTIGTGNDIVRLTLPADFSITAAANWSSQSSAVNFSGLAADSSFGVGVAPAGALYSSPAPLTTWTSRTSGTANSLGYAAAGGGNYVAAGDTGTNTLIYRLTSPEGNWSAATSGLDGTTSFRGLASGAGLFVAITSDNEIITAPTSSPNGTWTSRTNPGGTTIANLTFDGTRFFAYSGDTFITSTDGITWAGPYDTGVGGGLLGITSITIGGVTIYVTLRDTQSSLFYATAIDGAWTVFPFDSHVSDTSPTARGFFFFCTTTRRTYFVDTNQDFVFSKAM